MNALTFPSQAQEKWISQKMSGEKGYPCKTLSPAVETVICIILSATTNYIIAIETTTRITGTETVNYIIST